MIACAKIGHVTGLDKQRKCIDCKRERASEWNRNNPIKALLNAAKGRAKRKGISFDLTPEDIVIPTHCPWLKIPLDKKGFGKCGSRENVPSLERIDSALGYVRGNVLVISNRANRIKSDATLKELTSIVQGIREHNFEKEYELTVSFDEQNQPQYLYTRNKT